MLKQHYHRSAPLYWFIGWRSNFRPRIVLGGGGGGGQSGNRSTRFDSNSCIVFLLAVTLINSFVGMAGNYLSNIQCLPKSANIIASTGASNMCVFGAQSFSISYTPPIFTTIQFCSVFFFNLSSSWLLCAVRRPHKTASMQRKCQQNCGNKTKKKINQSNRWCVAYGMSIEQSI